MSIEAKAGGSTSRDFVKVFDRMCGARSRWNIWSDFLHLSAYSISNAVDMIHREKREKDYNTIAGSYTKQEMLEFSELFAITTMALEENPDQDFLGHLYMELELGNKNTGQFFTPFNVAKMSAMVSSDFDKIEQNHFSIVNDCCIGGGAMLLGFASACREREINYQKKVMFVAQDIDFNCCCMAYIQLSLLGCPAYVVCDDSLIKPLTWHPLFAPMDRETFITPMYCSFEWEFRRKYHILLNAVGVKGIEKGINSEKSTSNIKARKRIQKEEKINENSEENIRFPEPVQMTFFD